MRAVTRADGGGPESDDGAVASPAEPVGVDAVDDPAKRSRDGWLSSACRASCTASPKRSSGALIASSSRVWAMDRSPRCRCVLTELVDTPSVSAMSGMERSR